ncbi:MAG TPA: helix-turn-helix domain-containing protein [Pedomonas sp.]|uniref:helix-turn-helix domain-containing protein n=1 Tax=Pedomonas sp. TaxID=2976421 RepID=UPI002F409270
MIEECETAPSLTDVAEALALTPSYFHRIFKAHIGLTPKGYAAAHRAKRVREALAGENSITEAIYDRGHARFRYSQEPCC